jgi:hypothetical protein
MQGEKAKGRLFTSVISSLWLSTYCSLGACGDLISLHEVVSSGNWMFQRG